MTDPAGPSAPVTHEVPLLPGVPGFRAERNMAWWAFGEPWVLSAPRLHGPRRYTGPALVRKASER